MGALLAILSVGSCFFLLPVERKVDLNVGITIVLFILTAVQLISAPKLRANMESQLITRQSDR